MRSPKIVHLGASRALPTNVRWPEGPMLNTTNTMAMSVPIDDLIIRLDNTSPYRLGKRRLHPQLRIRFHCVDDLR